MSKISEWTVAVSSIGARGLDYERRASREQCAALAAELGIVSCQDLCLTARIFPLEDGRFRLEGRLHAKLQQSCVVSLDPVDEQLDEPIDIEFWPSEQLLAPIDGEQEILAGEDPEPIEAGHLHIGRLVEELVSANLAPYPRSPDVELEVSSSPGPEEQRRDGPFAALADWTPSKRG